MTYREVTDVENPPLTLVEASAREGDTAAQSLAASLLLLGNQQRDELAAFDAVAASSGAGGGLAEAAPVEDVESLRVPLVRPTGERYGEAPLRAELEDRCGLAREARARLPRSPAPRDADREEAAAEAPRDPEDEGADGDADAWVATLPAAHYAELAEELHREPRPDRLAVLLEACLFHPDPLVDTAAAIAYQPLAADPLRLLPILEDGLDHPDPEVRDLAATGLARFAPDHPGLARLLGGPPDVPQGHPADTSLLVHGTWAASAEWWRPGGSFHRYLRDEVPRFDDLYDQDDAFGWSGGYSHAARSLAARDLLEWVELRDEQGITLLGHSHGANAMMLASQQGLESELMLFLGCPVHRHLYWPAFERVDRCVSVRVRLDLVVLADGGGQRFRDPRIQEVRLPVWFSHSAPRDADTWRRHDVPGLIGF